MNALSPITNVVPPKPSFLTAFLRTADDVDLVDALTTILDAMDNRVGMNPSNDFENDMHDMRAALLSLSVTFPSNMDAKNEAMAALYRRREGYNVR